MNIVLIGARGSGKSSISRRLSRRTKRPVLSTDLLIQYEREGKEISALLAESGGDWRAFRELEYEVIEKATRLDGVIIDAGGGAIVDLDEAGEEVFSERKLRALRRHGYVVWLDGDPERLVKKIAHDASRPALSDRSTALQLTLRRIPWYEKASDLRVKIDDKSRRGITRMILRKLPFAP